MRGDRQCHCPPREVVPSTDGVRCWRCGGLLPKSDDEPERPSNLFTDREALKTAVGIVTAFVGDDADAAVELITDSSSPRKVAYLIGCLFAGTLQGLLNADALDVESFLANLGLDAEGVRS